MGWPTEMKDFLLIVIVFFKWPLTTDTMLQKASLAGRPLSDVEYENFFQLLTARRVVHAICFRRAVLGCHDPAIEAMDRYENHGVIPDGWICSDFPDNTSFPGFCDFALYRCILKNYFAKRVPCPDETTPKPTVKQTVEEDILMSTVETSFELPGITTTASTQISPDLLASIEAAGLEISLTPPPSTTAKASLLELLASSTIETATNLISQILTAFATTAEPSSELATTGTTTDFVTELTAASESSSEFTTTSTTAAESLTEVPFITEPEIPTIMEPELNPATTSTGSPSDHTTTIASPTELSAELATAVELFPESTSETTESIFDSTNHAATSATVSNTEPCVVDYPESLDTSSTLISSTVTTSPSSAYTLPTISATTLTEAATTTVSSMTTTSPQNFVPGFDTPLQFLPSQPNGTMRILILSFFRNKKVPKGDTAGISTLPQSGLGSGNIPKKEEIQNPLPASGLKDLFFQLHSKNRQQLAHKI